MFWIKNKGEDKSARYGFNLWKNGAGDYEVVVKIPLFLFNRKAYFDFDTFEIKSGACAWTFGLYIRKRGRSLVKEGLKRWIVEPKILKGKWGKQVLVMGRSELDDNLLGGHCYTVFKTLGMVG